ncbi:MFS transporter [Halospeciosus flavus]|uniref:MFS transporter n=1 Tax=Halospeciosus flavus TaxID=3032283 RepID=A0ABD5Z460_9EURY|nr:MFS transporter [Halospeciosus flavus]
MSTTDSPLSLFRDREFVALAGTAFARSQAYSTILIALALYADLFHTSGLVEGLFGTSFALVQLLIVLPLGRAVDTHDAKKFLLVGLLVNVVVFVGFIFVQSPAHVILVRLVQGLGASVLWITGSTVVGEISDEGERGRWLGTYNQVGAFSSFAGDLVGGYLLYTYSFKWTYLVLTGITLVVTVLVYFFLRDNPGGKMDPEEQTSVETFKGLLRRPMVRALVSFRLAFSVGKMAVIIFLPIYARTEFGVSALAIGGILAGGKLVKAGLQAYMGDLTDRLGNEHRFVLVGALLYAVGTAMIPLAAPAERLLPMLTLTGFGQTLSASGAIVAMFAAYAVIGVADSIRLPASMSMFVEEGERFDSVASSMSLRSISWKIGQVLGPLLVGVVTDLFGMGRAFLVAAGFIVFASGVFVFTYSRHRDPTAPGVEEAGGDD